MGILKYVVVVAVTAVAVKVLPSFYLYEELPRHFGGQILDSKFRKLEQVFKYAGRLGFRLRRLC